MFTRILQVFIGKNGWFEIWIGFENERSYFEFRVELNVWKLSFTLPIRWLKEE